MIYRFAERFQDLAPFDAMLRAYLREEENLGSPVRLTVQTLDSYRKLAGAYVRGAMAGVIVFAEEDGRPVGFAMAGEDTAASGIETTLGRVAFVWIAWVEEAHRKAGVGLSMLKYGRPRLLDLGFQTASMNTREGNSVGEALCAAYGAREVERVYHVPLAREPGHGQWIDGERPAESGPGDSLPGDGDAAEPVR